jgi:hypothetical protein
MLISVTIQNDSEPVYLFVHVMQNTITLINKLVKSQSDGYFDLTTIKARTSHYTGEKARCGQSRERRKVDSSL